MSTLTWGSGGTQRSTNTSAAGDGWYTPYLAMPNVRAIYDASKPIEVASVVANAGSGSRAYAYATGQSGWLSSGFHHISDTTVFTFRVTRASGTIYLGLFGQSGFTTYWVSSDDPVNWSPNGVQPGTMTYYQAPSAPGLEVTPGSDGTSINIDLSAPSDNGGRTVAGYTVQVSTVSSFATIAKEVTLTADGVVTGLTPGTTYYVRAMAKNAVTTGVGKKGGAASTTRSVFLGKAPITAPGLSVDSSASGTSAIATVTPPSDAGGLPILVYEVTAKYIAPLPVPPVSVIVVDSPGSGPVPVENLIPGATYDWSVVAFNALGASPVSATVRVTQRNPSTSPGDYFDGATPATDDQTYSWTGAPNNSTSIATSKGRATGWQLFQEAALGISGGTGVQARVSGGFSGAFAARYTFLTDATAAGFLPGLRGVDPGRASVVPLQVYTASMYVMVSRTQRMAMRLSWDNTGSLPISSETGPGFFIPADGAWHRVWATFTAPPLAAFVAVRITDVAGDGWSLFRGGDVVTLDAAMLTLGTELMPYFDGDTVAAGGYTYSWVSATPPTPAVPNASVSVREPAVTVEVDPLADPACEPIPRPPRAPNITDECIEEASLWNRYWAEIPATVISDWLTVLPTLVFTTLGKAARQIRFRVYPDPFGYGADRIDPGGYCSEQIISYLPASTVLTIDGPLERVFAEVRGAAAIAADHLLYGSGGTPAKWPALSCGIQYLVSVDLPLEFTIDDFDYNVSLTRRT